MIGVDGYRSDTGRKALLATCGHVQSGDGWPRRHAPMRV